jgi:hypothetical protein
LSSSSIEGGNFKCFKHDFETDDPVKWDTHCVKEGHTMSGVAPCAICGESVEFKGLAYVPIVPRHQGKIGVVVYCEEHRPPK